MSLTVETGAVVAGADSYVSLAEYRTYAGARNWSLQGFDDLDEADLRRAFDVLNREWTYKGEEVDLENQTGAWPRYIVKNRWEYVTPANDIPQKIKDAQCEIAYLIKGGLDPLATIKGIVKRAGAGPASVEFLGGQGKPKMVAIEGLLRPFLAHGPGQAQLVRG